MSREPFEVRIPRLKDDPDPSIDITASDSEDLLNLKIPLGHKLDELGEVIEDLSVFTFLHGKAVARDPNELHLTDVEAYNGFAVDYGLTHFSDHQSAIHIASIYDTTEHSLKEQSSDLYLIVYRDLNHNDAIDDPEVEFIVLDF